MLGVKLRSGKVDQYDALGERGQPVYQAAPQILSTLKRRRADLAQHFAIPQASADGSIIDWYAPGGGPVVPWSAATESEKSAALGRLAEVGRDVNTLRSASDEGDASLFTQLLRWVLHHPDPSYVYLVDGKPVITFWGFLHAGADRNLEPLHALHSPSPASLATSTPAALLAPRAAATMVTETAAAVIPWWKRWWLWFLLLPLLLALLLFGLHACSPGLVGGRLPPGLELPQTSLPTAGGDSPRARVDLGPALTMPGEAAAPTVMPPASSVATHSAGTASSEAAPIAADAQNSASPPAPAVGTAQLQAAAELPSPGQASVPLPAASDKSVTPPALADAAAPAASSGTELAIPAAAPDGKANFLNGNWLVRAGIQDRNTGEPLRLQYEFQDGDGQVTLRRHDGVSCQAPVRATVAGGVLAINSGASAACTDGHVYEMPVIRCKSGETRVAACQGSYGNVQFPLTMRQPQS